MACGTGGVGKTTISAALAISQAQKYKKIALISVDPAKRLASALGIDSLNNDPYKINVNIKEQTGKSPSGQIYALMLDAKDTFHDFVLKFGGADCLEAFEKNNLFHIISSNISGIHDYMILEKLHTLIDQYELIVLDTPPAKHTLDFLEAPTRIANFFDDRIFKYFLKSTSQLSLSEKFKIRSAQGALRILQLITGAGVIEDFTAIAPHMLKLKTAFVERQANVLKILKSDICEINFVTSPNTNSLAETKAFRESLDEMGLKLNHLIINRSIEKLVAESSNCAVSNALTDFRFLASLEGKNRKELESILKPVKTIQIPEFATPIYNLTQLSELTKFL